MLRIAVVGAILEEPEKCQREFNEIVSSFKNIVRGRAGTPFPEGVAVVSLTLFGGLDEINALTGKLGKLPNVQVKTSISKKEFLGGATS